MSARFTPLSETQYEMVSFGGYVSLAAPVSLELLFLGRVYRGQFLLADQEWGILGRTPRLDRRLRVSA